MQYVCKIEKEDDGYNVTFPDIPEAITCGFSLDEALEYAKDCLQAVLEYKLSENEPLPLAKTVVNEKEGLYSVQVDSRLAIAYEIFEARRGKSTASICRKMGITRQAYQRLENPKSNLSVSMLNRVAAALGKRLEVKFV